MSIETMKQALEALENPWKAKPEGVANAITALRQAIERAQEPVAWMDEEMTCIFFDTERPEPFDFDFWKPLYTSPPQRQPEQEPVALPPIYFMRDNHTFKILSNDVSTALIEIEQEFNEGWTYGSLCSKRKGFAMIHASGDKTRLKFFAECKAALEAAHGIKE